MLTYGPTRRSSCSGRSQSNPTPVSPSPSGTITRASDAWSVMSSRHIPHGGTTSPHRCTATIVSISVSPSAAARPIATASAETNRRLQMHRTGHHSGSCPQCTTDLLPALFGAPSDDLACHRSEQTIALRVMTLLSVRAGQSFGRDSEPQRKGTFQHACRAATMLRGARSSLTHRKALRHAGRLWDERARRSSCTPLTAPPSPSHTRALLQWTGDDR